MGCEPVQALVAGVRVGVLREHRGEPEPGVLRRRVRSLTMLQNGDHILHTHARLRQRQIAGVHRARVR